MLDIFNRDRSYFQTLRDNGIYIESYNVDAQYDSLIDYINNSVVPEINSIVGGAFPGIIGSPNAYLSNVGDGTTEWLTIDKSINDYSLPFAKLIKANVGSVLATNGYGELTAIAATTPDQLLISQGDNSPIWKKIKTQNINDGGITGIDIANNVIDIEHLKESITTITIADGTITGSDFADNSITAEKFLNSSIGTEKLGIINHELPISPNLTKIGMVERNHIKNGVITPDKFKNFSINHTSFNKVRCITKGKIAAQTVDDFNFRVSRDLNDAYKYNLGDIKYSITSRKLHPDFRLTREKLATNSKYPYESLHLSDMDFDSETQSRFFSRGCRGMA